MLTPVQEPRWKSTAHYYSLNLSKLRYVSGVVSDRNIVSLGSLHNEWKDYSMYIKYQLNETSRINPCFKQAKQLSLSSGFLDYRVILAQLHLYTEKLLNSPNTWKHEKSLRTQEFGSKKNLIPWLALSVHSAPQAKSSKTQHLPQITERLCCEGPLDNIQSKPPASLSRAGVPVYSRTAFDR